MVTDVIQWIIGVFIPGFVNLLFSIEIVDGVVSFGSMLLYFGLLYFVVKFIVGRISGNSLNYATKQEYESNQVVTTRTETWRTDSAVYRETLISRRGSGKSRGRKKYK